MERPEARRVRNAESYRREARSALKGRWKSAVLAAIVLMLIGGVLLSACVTVEEGLFSYEVEGAIGPFSGQIRTGRGALGSAVSSELKTDWSGVILVAAAGLMMLSHVILTPVYELGWVRIGLRAVRGEGARLDAVAGVPYWKTVRVLLLQAICGYWPLLLALIAVEMAAVFLTHQVGEAMEIIALMALGVLIMRAVAAVNSLRFEPMMYLMEMKPRRNARRLAGMSRKLMKGNVGRLFGLGFSLIGWELLAVLPVIAGAIYLNGIGELEEISTDALNGLIGLNSANPVMLICQAAALLMMAAVGIYRHTATAAFVRDLAGESE